MNLLKKLVIAISISIALWISLRSDRPGDGGVPPSPPPVVSVSPAPASASAERPSVTSGTSEYREIGFRSRDRLEEHFQKHGKEFGNISIDQYLALAQALRDAPTGGDVLEVVRPVDGVISRFDRVSGAFLAANADGTIRTFFKPNDGEQYFRRQAKRPPSP